MVDSEIFQEACLKIHAQHFINQPFTNQQPDHKFTSQHNVNMSENCSPSVFLQPNHYKTSLLKTSLPFLSSYEQLTCFRVTKRRKKFAIQGSSKMVLTERLWYYRKDFTDKTGGMPMERKRKHSRLVKAPGGHHET